MIVKDVFLFYNYKAICQETLQYCNSLLVYNIKPFKIVFVTGLF